MMKPKRFSAISLYGIHKLGLAILIWLLFLLPFLGLLATNPATAAGPTPRREQATLTDLPLPTQFSISEAIGRDQSNYHLIPTSDGFRAVQPNHSLTADFSPTGLDLYIGGDHWTLSLTAYGYSDHLTPVEPAKPQAEANRLEYRRGPLTEWYRHGPLGLQQGFTLTEKPASNGPAEADQSPLTLALQLTGPDPCNLGLCSQARPSPQREQAANIGEDGRSLKLGNLSYSGLLAYDATGRELPIWLELQGDRLLLRVDDRNAVYPVLIDPWLQQTKLIASDGAASDWFGRATAVSSDTFVVGAYGDDSAKGAVYVFARSNTAAYAKLTASGGVTNDRFGCAVAISGNAIVVGAYGDDSSRGSAYVFVKPGGGWVSTSTFTAKLTASDGMGGDYFGSDVDISGDVVVVGANGDSGYRGSAYVFVKPSGGWVVTSTQATKLAASDGRSSDHFGNAVAVSGDTVVVGAPDAGGRVAASGVSYVFVKPSGGWTVASTQTTKLTAFDGAADDRFGFDVAINGDTVAVGADKDDDLGTDSGSVYVFVKPDGGWAGTNTLTKTAKLIASDGMQEDRFGSDVAVSGDTVVVGAPDGDGRANNSGAAYVFVKPSGGWASTNTFVARLTAPDGAASDHFGDAVAVSGDTIITGVYADDDKGSDSGSAYIFTYIPYYLHLPVVVKPSVGALTFRNDSGSPVTVTLFNHGTRAFGVGQQVWSDIPAGPYDWQATGTCSGQSGTVGSRQIGVNYRAPITITANQTATLNVEKGGRFSCAN